MQLVVKLIYGSDMDHNIVLTQFLISLDMHCRAAAMKPWVNYSQKVLSKHLPLCEVIAEIFDTIDCWNAL